MIIRDMLQPADVRRRNAGERFLVHLCDCGLFKKEWSRIELTNIYYDFCSNNPSFGGVLYQMSRCAPKLLHVHRGRTVIFRTSESCIYYWNELLERSARLKVTVKCHLEQSSVKEFSKNRFVCDIPHNYTPNIVLEVQLTNVSGLPVWLNSWKVLDETGFLDLADDLSEENLFIGHQERRSIQTICPRLQKMKILFNFNQTGIGRSFSSAIVVDFTVTLNSAHAQSPVLADVQQAPGPANVPGNARQQEASEVLPGVKPKLAENDRNDLLEKTAPLPPCLFPKRLAKMFQHNDERKRQTMACITDRSIVECFRAETTRPNYKNKFHHLLYVEELQYVEDVKYYNNQFQVFKRGQYLCLEVPGLAERRPSILRGDRLFARKIQKGIAYGSRYEGFVHCIRQTEIQLMFHGNLHANFQSISKMQLSIEFFFNRLPIKLMHRASELAISHTSLLFPSAPTSLSEGTSLLRIKNRDIEKNEFQLSAVKAIVRDDAAPVYIIYGPPGTGKTVTMVEAIFQTLEVHQHFHVLVCAPSNSACDLLTIKLMEHIDRRLVYRMHAASRQPTGIPSDIKDVSNLGMNDQVCFVSREDMMNFKVIVCTLITAGRISSAEFSDGHFNRIFIDESGQSMEPELMVAVAGILSRDGKLVLAGDPKQLGPIVRSPIAKSHGLQLSFLERLMNTRPYQKQINGKYNELCTTKLIQNYRSHETIIKVSNEEFYDNELEVHADVLMRNSLTQWDQLQEKGFPIIFKHVEGKDEQERNSPSFFNSAEIKEVKKFVKKLLSERRHRVKVAEIGVITPYRKQVQKIREVLRKEKIEDIKVGSVEEFQGQERRVIIISTVRSNTDYLKHDAKFHLGFVADPKRFNVAITRAKSLLIVVGNARLLCMDPYWRKLYRYCCENGAGGQRFDAHNLPHLRDFLQAENEPEGVSADDVEDLNAPEWRLDP